MQSFIFLLILVGILVFIYYSRKKQIESGKLLMSKNLDEYSKFKELIVDFDTKYENLKNNKVNKVNYTLNSILPKYRAMQSLIKYKRRIENWDSIIIEMLRLDTYQITLNVNSLEKEFLLIDKYGSDKGKKLFNHDYFIGMTIEMLEDAKGSPDKIEKAELKTKTKLIYIYGNKSSGDVFTFVNGICERYIDR